MKILNHMWNGIAKSVLTVMLCASVVLTSSMGAIEANAATVQKDMMQVMTADTSDNSDINVDGNGILGKNSDVGISVTESIIATAGEMVPVGFILKSNYASRVKLKCVYPVIDATFPFETSGDAYTMYSAKNEEQQLELKAYYRLTARSSIESGYHSIRFICEYTKYENDGTSTDYYVIKTINIYFQGSDSSLDDMLPGDDTNTDGDLPGDDTLDDGIDDGLDDGIDDMLPGDTYTGGTTSGSAPKLIITGYDTVPAKIMAGDTFTITIHVKNTSKNKAVCNGKFLIGNEAGSFLPTSGSSAVYVEKIPAGETGDISIEMKTSADLAQKSYILVVKGDFDDGNGNNYTSSDNISVPVYQEVKLGISEVSTSPSTIPINGTGSISCTVNNQGNAGVYNVTLNVKSDAVAAEECYVGNIAAAGNAYATINVTGLADNSDTGIVTLVVNYEDAEGNKGEMEMDVSCFVGEGGDLDIEGDLYGDDIYEDEIYDDLEGGGGMSTLKKLLIAGIIFCVVAVIITVIVIIVVKKKKKAKLLAEGEDDFEDEDF